MAGGHLRRSASRANGDRVPEVVFEVKYLATLGSSGAVEMSVVGEVS